MPLDVNESYQAILKLNKLLDTEGIPHHLSGILDGWIIEYFADGKRKGDVIQHCAVYGAERGVLEAWGFGLKEPVRCFSVEEAAEYFRKVWKEDGA